GRKTSSLSVAPASWRSNSATATLLSRPGKNPWCSSFQSSCPIAALALGRGRIRERRLIERTYRTRDIERFADRVQGATRCQKKSSASHFFVNSVLPLD